jgi:hypothetical protein
MVHDCRTVVATLVLHVTLFASADAGMEGRRLSLQNRLVIRMADNAVGRFDSLDRRVTGRTFVFQMGMGG